MIDCINFYNDQLQNWEDVKTRFEALDNVLSRSFVINGYKFIAQHNPARAISTGAAVDNASVKARPCFLCLANRSPKQKALAWISHDGTHYEFLINPFPIFHHHFTIALKDHSPQCINNRIKHLLELASCLDNLTVFYNGPRCGASAPDHHHFQAAPTKDFPLWEWIENSCYGKTANENITGFRLFDSTPVKFVLFEGKDIEETANQVTRIKDYITGIGEEGPEIPVNILARKKDKGLQCAVILRRKHRPECYTTHNDNGFMISPASVDLAGVFILPRKRDFYEITERDIKEICCEVTSNIKIKE